MIEHAAKLAKALTAEGNPFLKKDMFNLVTFAVPPNDVSKNIENRDIIGKNALDEFVTMRMKEGMVKFWDTQKKNNVHYFKDIGITVKAKLNNQLVSIRQERKLLSRLLIAAKRRPDFEVKDVIGDYELNVSPPSNFHPDGSMIMITGKSQVVPLVLKIPFPNTSPCPEMEQNGPSVLIIDAMCIVNMIPKTPDLLTAEHFSMQFVQRVADMGSTYDQIRVVFDQYLPGSLKETTRNKRTLKDQSIHYHVNDSTEIKNVKNFLSHIATKDELTKYLSDKLIDYYQGAEKKVLVMHHRTIEANVPLSEIVSMKDMADGQHNLEEGDQLVVLNAHDVMHRHPNAKLDVFSIDTDVFVLLTGLFSSLPESTTLVRHKKERISIKDSFLRLGSKRADAIIGWYAFKGTNTGSFAGKGVSSHMKAFLESDDVILSAFAQFGLNAVLPAWVFTQMERYLCLLYRASCKNVTTVKELRWELFAQKGKEGHQLPPTVGTLVPHTHRAHYMALVWRSSRMACPLLPPPSEYYWAQADDHLKPVCCVNPPAPHALLELYKCHCKTGCAKKTCGCVKNGLRCTDMCGCGDSCINVEVDRPILEVLE